MISQETNQTASWKHPWSLDEIVNSSRSWSLAADYGVCELLKKFSTDILNEVTQLNNNINELSIESRQTNVIIQNAFNDFCMLANNQFMENLVEDVNSSLLNEKSKEPAENSNSKEDKVAQLNMQVSESIRLGFQVLENQFEILDVQKVNRDALVNQDSDSEQVTNSPFESGNNEPIYHPKDPYEHRHLPHLIGTIEFVEDETLGIGYLDEFDESSEDFEVDSNHSERKEILDDLSSDLSDDSVAEDIKISNSRKRYSSSSGSSFDRKSKNDEDDISIESDLFNEKNLQSSVKKIPQDSHPAKALTLQEKLQEQLKKKLGLANTESNPSPMGSTTDIPTVTADSDESDLHDEEIMGSTVPMQHSGDDFLESDDDNKSIDLFSGFLSSKKAATVPSMVKPIPVTVPSATDVTTKQKTLEIQPLGEDSDDDEFFNSFYTKVPVATISTPNTSVKRKSPIKALDFGSDSDSDDMFKEKPVSKTRTKQEIPSKSSTIPPKDKLVLPSLNKAPEKSLPKYSSFNLDDDDDDDDDYLENLLKNSSKKPVTKADSLVTNKKAPAVKDDPRQSIDSDPLFQVSSSAVVPEVAKPSAEIASDLVQNSNQIEQSSYHQGKIEKTEPVEVEKKLVDDKKLDSSIAKEKIIDDFSEDSDDIFANMLPKELSTSIKVKTEIPAAVVEQVNNAASVFVATNSLNQKPMPSQETRIPKPVIPETDPLEQIEPKRKLPPGAVNPFGNLLPSQNIFNELQKHKNMKSPVITEPAQVEHDLPSITHNIPKNISKSSFADQLEKSISRPRPTDILIQRTPSKLSESPEEADINLEEPVQKVEKLEFLTKSRIKNMPRRRPTTKKTSDNTEPSTVVAPEQDNKETTSTVVNIPSDIPKQSIDNSANIFSDLPPRTEKKSKMNKKSKKSSKPIQTDVNIEDIDDIFAIPNTKLSKRAKSKVIDDPLGAM